MIDKMMDSSFFAAARALDASSLRQQVIAHNLANVNTPGYKRQDIQFETQLAQVLARKGGAASTGAAIEALQPRVVTNNATSQRPDGNNVDMEMENVAMAENTIRYEALSQSVTAYLGSMKSVITGR